jgi:hypothetical protein
MHLTGSQPTMPLALGNERQIARIVAATLGGDDEMETKDTVVSCCNRQSPTERNFRTARST